MTTFDRLMQDPKFKEEFEKGYNKFLISEFMIEKMEEDKWPFGSPVNYRRFNKSKVIELEKKDEDK